MYKAMIKKSKNKKGFTLVELIVVMAILAILAAILIPAVGGMIRRSNRAVDNSTARNLYMAASMAITEGTGESDDLVSGGTVNDTTMQEFLGSTTIPEAKNGGHFTVNIVEVDGILSPAVILGTASTDTTWNPDSGTFPMWSN